MNAYSLSSSSLLEVTTVEGTTIHAPNTSIVDDTPNLLLSRSVARLLAKGLHVVGIYGGEDEGSSVAGRIGVQTWEVDVALSSDEEAIGSVIVKVITECVPLRSGGSRIVRSSRIGFDNVELARALRWHGLDA